MAGMDPPDKGIDPVGESLEMRGSLPPRQSGRDDANRSETRQPAQHRIAAFLFVLACPHDRTRHPGPRRPLAGLPKKSFHCPPRFEIASRRRLSPSHPDCRGSLKLIAAPHILPISEETEGAGDL